MEKPNAVIEITNSVIRIVVGYVVNEKPSIIFTHEVSSEGAIENGEIKDFDKLVSILESLKVISDPESHVRITLKEATLLLPAVGFSVFTSEKSTGVVSQAYVIQEIDIKNAIGLVQRDPLPNTLATVDIIPLSFALEGNQKYSYPPISKKSQNLTVSAFIHALPKHIYDSYLAAFEKVDIVIKRSFVSVYALSELVRTKEKFPKSYILIDMGEGVTTLTLIGDNYPYNSTHFAYGSKQLAHMVSETFNISEALAKEYVFKYGIDESNRLFNPAIGNSIPAEEGSTTCFTSKDLTALIKTYLDSYKQKLEGGILALCEGLSDEVKHLPFVLSGGFASLHGVKEYIENNFENETYYLQPSSVGVRHSRFSASVGALLLSSHYRGSLTDALAKVAEVKREE